MRADMSGNPKERDASSVQTPDGLTSPNNKSTAGAPSRAAFSMVTVERNAFLRDCLQRSLGDVCQDRTFGCGSLSELAELVPDIDSALMLLSTLSLTEGETEEELVRLKDIDPRPHTMVLGKNDNLDCVLFALNHGANGYISISAGLEVFIEALRFVGAGGTYVPPQCLFQANKTPTATTEQTPASIFTSREMAVIQAIRNGKPNKVIAYDLNMCESTVKVHVRHIMKKLHARNRTDVAMKAADLPIKGADSASTGPQGFAHARPNLLLAGDAAERRTN